MAGGGEGCEVQPVCYGKEIAMSFDQTIGKRVC